MLENITLTKTKSSISETLETILGDYKVVSNITVEGDRITRLNGYVGKAEAEAYMGETTSWNASKRNGEWGVDFDWMSVAKNDEVTDLVIAVVNAVVAQYEVAE